ncbi:MAG: 50S ribosomal protein L3 [Endomicrobiales bacterium]|nr:50S ribosomal protein L3 [Endomicrobiales bacterium]
MLKSILGNKVGMTQIFDETGNIIPVTVVDCSPCIVANIRTKENDGYCALQLGFGNVKEKSLSKPLAGQFKKKNIPVKKYLREFRIEDVSQYTIGQEIKSDIFKAGEYVDVSGVSKGKGFAGTVKRHGFQGGVTTHGQSDRQRAPGSIGAQRPTHVIKGKRMAGHLGHEMVTVQKLKIVAVDTDKNILLISGAVPGVSESLLIIEKTVKKVTAPDAQQSQKKKAKGGKK